MHKQITVKVYRFRTIAIFLLLISATYTSFCQTYSAPGKNLLKVKGTTDFTLTGDGGTGNWKDAAWINLQQHGSNTLKKADWHVGPQTGSASTLRYNTAFKVMYSKTGIYCLFQCEDSMVTATLKGDYLDLFTEDVVEIFLRPDTAMPAYFEYELSPLNYELPILIVNNKGKIMGWKPWQYEGEKKTRHAIKIQEKNPATNRFTWTAEIFIPYTLLMPMDNVPPKKGTQWRANFYRIDYDRDPIYFGWQLTRRSFHDPERFGTLEFE
jgi:hypothetical protein